MTQHALRWGILSTGKIAAAFASHLPQSSAGELVAVASRTKDKAEAFAKEHGGRALGSYDELVAADDVDAVYVATPHPQHAEWAIKLLRGGKHVLCEKPLCVNAADAEAVLAAAEDADRVLMEAFMYRCHPQTAKLVEFVRGGAIGEVQHIEAAFSFRGPDDPSHRLMSPDLAGGGILDVGCYATSVARLIAGAAVGQPFAEPVELKGVAHLGKTGVDEWAAAVLKFENGITAELRTGVRLRSDVHLVVYGTDGKLVVGDIYIPAKNGGTVAIEVTKPDGTVDQHEVTTEVPLYGLEAEAFARAVAAGAVEPPAMTPADTLGNMRALDTWRREVGLVYPSETPAGYRGTTVAGEPLRRREDAPMTSAKLPDVPFAPGRMVMGCDNQRAFASAAPLYDAFFEAGGNCFDTAVVYGPPRSRLLGEWIAHRGLRDQVAVICKGAHPPNTRPDAVAKQLDAQLEWLGSDYCDLYFLHRDDPDVPIGEWVDVLNDLADANRIRGPFGGSNWSLERVKEANAWAKANGKRGFGAVSQNLSLAEMVDPIWKGCQSAHDDAWLAWLAQTGTPNFSWSSQARGFFVPDRDLAEPEIQRCWVSEANLERRRRCFELAEAKGVRPINIAAAWVLKQAFPSFALIGPRNLGELRTTLPAFGIDLSDAEHAWLDLRADAPT